MPTLIIDFHCMCLFVPDRRSGAVHVLMPHLHGPDLGPQPASAHYHSELPTIENDDDDATDVKEENSDLLAATPVPEKHVVRLLHRSFSERLGRPMEGWSLVLEGRGPANLTLDPSPWSGAELPDLSVLSGRRADPQLIDSNAPSGVISRVTLRAGAKMDYGFDFYKWTLGGIEKRRLANIVTWVIPNVPERLKWISIGATGPEPLPSLRDLTPEAEDVYRISIHHETERTLPGAGGPLLSILEMQQHFATFYSLLGMEPPDPKDTRYVPDRAGSGGGSVFCRSGKATLAD